MPACRRTGASTLPMLASEGAPGRRTLLGDLGSARLAGSGTAPWPGQAGACAASGRAGGGRRGEEPAVLPAAGRSLEAMRSLPGEGLAAGWPPGSGVMAACAKARLVSRAGGRGSRRSRRHEPGLRAVAMSRGVVGTREVAGGGGAASVRSCRDYRGSSASQRLCAIGPESPCPRGRNFARFVSDPATSTCSMTGNTFRRSPDRDLLRSLRCGPGA